MKGLIGRKTKYHSLFYGIKGYNKNEMKILIVSSSSIKFLL